MRMSVVLVAVSALLTHLVSAPADAQRAPRAPAAAPAAQWELLGETQVGFGVDRDVISVGRPEDHFKSRSYERLRFVAERGPVRLREVKVRYINGQEEVVRADRLLRPSETFVLDLPGRRSFLSQIELAYSSEREPSIFNRWNRPRVKVFGERKGGLPPPDVAKWDEIGTTAIGRGDSEATIRVGAREGRFGEIRLRNDGPPLELNGLSIRFGNGETQTIAVRDRLGTGELSRPIDVDGRTRFIERIAVRFQPLRAGNRGNLVAYGNPASGSDRPGSDRPGRPPPMIEPQRSWVPLGEQQVSYRQDRDVVRLGNDEGWYRTRSFDKLHFLSGGGDVDLSDIKVTYINGYTEVIRVGRELRRGASLTVDLPGARSYLREIEMNYRTKPGSDERGLIKIFGEPARR